MRRQRLRGYTLGLAALLFASIFLLSVPAAPITLTVPYVPTAVADADLDGDPATGSWSDAGTFVVPLENGLTNSYGSAQLRAKHDGTYVYLRIDGKIDVPWTSASGNHFWFGVLFSPTRNGHHQSSQDSVFFGETGLSSAVPILPVDCHGGSQPPARDSRQDDVGEMRASGSAAPYDFTAEWKRALNTNDTQDLVFLADGSTAYYFYATTDSNGGGSRGGSIGHKATTNDNVIRFARVPGADVSPPSVSIMSPADSATVNQSVLITATASDDVGVASVTFLLDGQTLAVDTVSPYEYAWSTSGVADGTHTVRAEARDAAGNVASTEITVVVVSASPDTVAPAAPRGLAVLSSESGATLVTWSPGTETDLLGYFVFRMSAQGDPVQLNGEALREAPYIDRGLVPGATYTYVVVAVDLSGNRSPASEPASGTAGAATGAFDVTTLGWVAGPTLAGFFFLLVAKLAIREDRLGNRGRSSARRDLK